MTAILLTATVTWLALGLLMYAGVTWKTRHPGSWSSDQLNGLATAVGLLLVFHGLYGGVLLALGWAAHGIWWLLH